MSLRKLKTDEFDEFLILTCEKKRVKRLIFICIKIISTTDSMISQDLLTLKIKYISLLFGINGTSPNYLRGGGGYLVLSVSF